MRAVALMFFWVAMLAHADTDADALLPVTIDERTAACVANEDSDPARAIALADSVLAEATALTLTQRVEALGCRGWAQASLSRNEEARRDAQVLQGLLKQFETVPDRVRLTRRVGGILHRSGDRVGAVELYAQAVADAEAQGLEAERIPLLVNLGVLHSEFEEHERARINYEQALALMQRLDNHRYEAPVRFNLGLNLNGQGKHAEALPHLRRTLQLVRETGMGGPLQEIAVSLALATALFETGAVDESQAMIDQVRAMDVPVREGSLWLNLQMIEARQREAAGDVAGALALLDAIEAGSLPEIQQGDLLQRRAELQQALGRFEAAIGTLRELNRLRETYLRHQNHERLAALDAHMRDREQRLELERLQVAAEAQARRIEFSARTQWATAIALVLLLLIGGGVLLWQRRMNRRLFEASRTDPLTGLANRRDMAQRLRELGLQAHSSTVVMLIDIDLFKRINDDYGHDTGDTVLVDFAQRLQQSVAAGASVARWGGEEFLVLHPHADAPAACALAETLRVELSRPIATARGQIKAHVSIGFANLPLPGAQGAEAWHPSVQLADSALYLAKRAGRDAWVGYWIDAPVPDWNPERLGREPQLARSLGLIEPMASKPMREPLTAARA